MRTLPMPFFLAVLLALSAATFAGPPMVESDPDVVRVLPRYYPLNRARVKADEYPWRAIGLVSLLGGRNACTGTLIGPRYVLTAAHCVYRVRNFPREIHFLAGYEQDRYVAHSRARKVLLNKTFTMKRPSMEVFANDWALIELEEPIGEKAGHLGWADLDSEGLKQLETMKRGVKLAGYRRDRKYVQTVDHRCRITGLTANDRLILHRCPLTGGDSGGPILMPYGDKWLVVGIDVGVRIQRSGQSMLGRVSEGYAVPTTRFRNRLVQLGIRGTPIDGNTGLKAQKAGAR